MRRSSKAILILLSLASCNNNLQQQKGKLTDSIPANTSTIALAGENNPFPDTVYLPDKDKNYIGLLLFIPADEPFVYHNDEVLKNWEHKEWYGLVKKGDEYSIQKTKIRIESAYDIVVDEDSTEKTGWAVTSDLKTEVIIHFAEIGEIKEGNVRGIQTQSNIVKAGDTLAFQYNGIEYILFATADYKDRDNGEAYMNVANYKLFFNERNTVSKTKQLLFAAPRFDDAFPQILFIGDIDRDGKPDILLNAVWHYNEFAPALYLSGYAGEHELIKLVAMNSSVGC